MEDNLLYKYISGEASETEKKEVTEWIQESPEHLHEYLTQRKLYNIALWQDTPIDKNNANKGKVFILRKVAYSIVKIAALVAIVLLVTYIKGTDKKAEEITYQSIYVPAGQRAELMLADGTKVWLNSRSTLKFPTSFLKESRNVILDGEGFFKVTKNKKSPFIVSIRTNAPFIV